jgi:hypothetical protein
MISFYFSPHRGPVSWDRDKFAKFIIQIPPLSAHFILEDGNNSIQNIYNNMNFFIRYENLNDDFKKVCNLIGIPWEPLPVRNISKREPYQAYYDDELVELVRKRFSEEINFFGYEFEKAI